MAKTNSNELDLKSIRKYGLHGSVALLMGFGIAYLLSMFSGIFIIRIIPEFSSHGFFFGYSLIIYLIFSVYTGSIFGKMDNISLSSLRGITTGILCGIAGFAFSSGSSMIDPLFFITPVAAGLVFAFPKLKNMAYLSASGVLGGLTGYLIYISGESAVYYLNSTNMISPLVIILVNFLSLLFAIGIVGASIAIGIFFIEKKEYGIKDIPVYLKILRGAGIILTVIVLLFFSIMFLSVAHYASTSVSIDVVSGQQEVTLLVPVMLDENDKIFEMYGKPEITGSALTSIIDTEHGKALKITGTGTFRIYMSQIGGKLAGNANANDNFVNGFTLSTSNSTNYGEIYGAANAWIYSDNDDVSFSMSIQQDNGWGRDMRISTEKSGKLSKGWQEIRILVMSMMYD